MRSLSQSPIRVPPEKQLAGDEFPFAGSVDPNVLNCAPTMQPFERQSDLMANRRAQDRVG